MESDFEELLDYYKNSNLSKDEELICDNYLKAFENKDEKRLDEYAELGWNIRHRVMNMNAYNHNILFGYYHKTLDKCNWLDRSEMEIETIIFKTNSAKDNYSSIRIGKSPNGKYAYGWDFNFGNGGSGSAPSVYGVPFDSREECVTAAMQFAKLDFEKAVLSKGYTDSDKALIRRTLAAIYAEITPKKEKEIKIYKTQLELFE